MSSEEENPEEEKTARDMPKVPPDDKGLVTPVKDGKTGKITWATVLTRKEVQKEAKGKGPLDLPVNITPIDKDHFSNN